jgi:hypothetical protein
MRRRAAARFQNGFVYRNAAPLGDYYSVRAEALRASYYRAEVVRVFDSVAKDKQKRLALLPHQNILDFAIIEVTGQGYNALMLVRFGKTGKLARVDKVNDYAVRFSLAYYFIEARREQSLLHIYLFDGFPRFKGF